MAFKNTVFYLDIPEYQSKNILCMPKYTCMIYMFKNLMCIYRQRSIQVVQKICAFPEYEVE